MDSICDRCDAGDIGGNGGAVVSSETSMPTMEADPTSRYGQDEDAEMPLRKIHHPAGAYTAEEKRSSPR